MKTKQAKEEIDGSINEDNVPEVVVVKKRGRKKKLPPGDNVPNTSKEAGTKRTLVNRSAKPVTKRPLGIRKTLRNKKVIVAKNIKNVIKQAPKRGRGRVAIKLEPVPEVDTTTAAVPLIPPSEIKKEPVEEVLSNSRSSSPKTAGKRQRLSSDMLMMKSVLTDTPSSLVIGPRTSPYSMRSERSNSPSIPERKSLRSGKPRKLKTNLLNEVVKNEQKKRRLLSDTKLEQGDISEEAKNRGRSCSRDSSEVSKCSDITESDASLSEAVSIDTDAKVENLDLLKKIEKAKTDIEVDSESSIQISTINTDVPSFNNETEVENDATEMNHSNSVNREVKKKMSLTRSTSLDSDNNNTRNRIKLDNVHNSSDIEDKSKVKRKTDKDALFKTRSNILTSMSKTFNSIEITKTIKKTKATRGRKAATVVRANEIQLNVPVSTKNDTNVTLGIEPIESGPETLESLSSEIQDLISTLEDDKHTDDDMTENLIVDRNLNTIPTENTMATEAGLQTKIVSKFYGLGDVKPLSDNNTIAHAISDTPNKDKEPWAVNAAITPSKNDDSENIRLHFDTDDSMDKTSTPVKESEVPYKCGPVASIDKLMDRLKVFEEFDKKRQSELLKTNESVMVTSDVVLIPKSGADIKPLKDIQAAMSPEKPLEKENVLSCFENNSAISIVKRDQARKSLDVDVTNSVTLIKRNSISARKESTGSNHSRESTDAITIFEKSLGKDVTLTEIRKSVDKSNPSTPVEIHQFATLHPNSGLVGVKIDSNQVSITPRSANDQNKQVKSSDTILTKTHSRDSTSRKSSESVVDIESDKLATIERIKSPPLVNSHPIKSPSSQPPVAIKSPEAQPMDTEALAAPLENVKTISENISMTSETPEEQEMDIPESSVTKLTDNNGEQLKSSILPDLIRLPEELDVGDKEATKPVSETIDTVTNENETELNLGDEVKEEIKEEVKEEVPIPPKAIKISTRGSKSSRNSLEQAGPSNVILETPESQKRKEFVFRTLGLLTHKAANEAKIEKQKEKERIYAKTYGQGGINKNKTAKLSGDYTGTLKTIIKLNRGTGEREKGKKYRSSLKMTFQKSKHRAGKLAPEMGEAAKEDEAFYTIERREGLASTGAAEGPHRKSHYSNRFNHGQKAVQAAETIVATPTEPVAEVTKEPTINLVIPEKASSFSIHPGRLCMDQCCYCGGKFGLFDTPCHIAQMKSAERQKKVLDNEEKLTIDSCLCDACYRHVDRRANCPSYRKRPLNKALAIDVQAAPTTNVPAPTSAGAATDKSVSPTMEDDSDEDSTGSPLTTSGGRAAICHTTGCGAPADHTIRRKWLIKMRTRVNSVLKLELDYPGLHTIPLCSPHYRALVPLMTCALCRRRINKHHNLHLVKHGYLDLNPLLAKEGIPVEFTERPVLCKMCRYYCSLLQRPFYNSKASRSYRIRLLQTYNIEIPPEAEEDHEENRPITDEDLAMNSKQKKKGKVKTKQRKTSEQGRSGEELITEPIVEIREGTDKLTNDQEGPTQESQKSQNMEEDIESLISSNKILVPTKPGEPGFSDNSDQEMMQEMEGPVLALDKQTELQYLLQKQNNPAQFLQKPITNLTQKQKNLFKTHNISIQKPGLQHRIHDKNSKKIHKLGQIVTQKERRLDDIDMLDLDKMKEAGISIIKNINLNDECTIESIPTKKSADINTLKNKWQMSESFTQVKKNLSELKKLSVTDGRRSDMKYSNPVKRLETNPSISVRELFPGEEEMNLHCSIEFNNVKGVTPEGWEKCSTTIQYDTETRKLWHELQRPYGNQSSFLRHLVLLEKYFRSGDLILAHNANTSAVNYNDSVQSRLRAYDNVPSEPSSHNASGSLIEFRKKPSVNGKSLLKSNQSIEIEKAKSPEMKKPMPPGLFVKPPKVPKSSESKSSKNKPLPPELIAINTPNAQGRKAIQNVLHNIQQLVKGVSASDPTEIAAAPLPKLPDPPKIEVKMDPPKANPPKKQKTTSKPWRPTLMPITQENLDKIAREPNQVAVDGRTLPSLVQVMSSGKRYHITLQDYNKMCIMRREKLQQLQDGEAKTKRSCDTMLVTEIQPSTVLGNGGIMKQAIEKPEMEKITDLSSLSQIETNAATILKNVGLKNITIAPIPAKTSTVTSQTMPAATVTSPPILMTSTPIKMPQFGSAVTITSETILSSPIVATAPQQSAIIMPKIPKSLTVIPQAIIPIVTQAIPPIMTPTVAPFAAQTAATIQPVCTAIAIQPAMSTSPLVPEPVAGSVIDTPGVSNVVAMPMPVSDAVKP